MRASSVKPASTRNGETGTSSRIQLISVRTLASASTAATAYPSAPLPTSPMKIRARGKLNGRNPRQARPRATAASEYGHGSTGASPSIATTAWLAAMPLMPSMKFQMLISEAVNSSTSAANSQLPPFIFTRPASSVAAMKCTSRRRIAGRGLWSSHQPIPATSTSPRLATSTVGVLSGQAQMATAAVTSRLMTMAMPPPRGVATLWLRRSPGWSINCWRSA